MGTADDLETLTAKNLDLTQNLEKAVDALGKANTATGSLKEMVKTLQQDKVNSMVKEAVELSGVDSKFFDAKTEPYIRGAHDMAEVFAKKIAEAGDANPAATVKIGNVNVAVAEGDADDLSQYHWDVDSQKMVMG